MTQVIAGLSTSETAATSGPADSQVILLHGYGADGADLIGLADPLGPHLPRTRFLAPDAPERCANNPMGFQWFPIPWLDGTPQAVAETAATAAFATLNIWLDAVTSGPIGPERTVLLGFSQGTMMALHVGPRRPRALAGIVGFSGRLLKPELLSTEIVTKPPVLLIHGDQDQMVPYTDLALAADGLSAAGIEVYAHTSRGMGHGIAPDGLGQALAFIQACLKTG